ncbi:MAG: hypothetical protein ACFCUR_09210 [Rhodomicrobiaceae bacterium]
MATSWSADTFVKDMNCFATPYRLPIYAQPRHGRSARTLPTDFPDYLVYVTRETLLGGTTSLSRVSDDTHNFFLQARQMMAADRMMRAFFPWAAPSATAKWPFASSASLTLPAPQAMQLLPYFGNLSAISPKTQQKHAAVFPDPFGSFNSTAPVFAAFMSASAAALAATPSLFQSAPTFV